MWECKHCKKEFVGYNRNKKANHSRWCEFNPKKELYLEKLQERDSLKLMREAKIAIYMVARVGIKDKQKKVMNRYNNKVKQ
jgi:hypothetical protein